MYAYLVESKPRKVANRQAQASDSISEDSSLQAEQIVELEGVLWFVGIVLASRVEYQRKSSLYQSPNGSIQLQLQLSIEPLGCLVL